MTVILKSIIFIGIFAVFLGLVHSFSDDDLDMAVNQCLEDNNISREEYVALMNVTSSEESDDDLEMKYKCALHCLAVALEVVDSNGYVDVELVENHGKLTEDNYVAFTECKEENDYLEDMCEYAYKFVICLQTRIDLNAFNNETD
ncbi:general odorant-binding protein 57c [Drosophila nasuta]|uniref:general odorant-binding protein 57c n=1 Tax=Drosophila nasuta TaxID=42062 RepID=UPI00295E9EF9|nr:general odorant-binding protein 57c [Drosophila nasuta]